MRYFFSFILFLSLQVQGVELPKFEGLFSFSKNDLSLVQLQHIVFLSTGTDEGKGLVQSLRDQNYICRQVYSPYFTCKKFLKDLQRDPAVDQALVDKNSHINLRFIASNEDYELVNDAPSLVELQRNQESAFNGQVFDKIHFYVIPGLIKFKLYQEKAPINAEYFYINQSNQIAQQITAKKINEKPIASVIEDKYIYVYEAVWK